MKMKRNLWLPAMVIGLLPIAVAAGPDKGDQEIILSATSDWPFDDITSGTAGGYGRFLSDHSLIGVRQSVNWTDREGGDRSWSGATRGFYQFHFDLDRQRPFAGASLGGIYGEAIDESFFAGPEFGVKYYASDTAFINLIAKYQFFFEEAGPADEAFEEDTFFYGLGIGYNF